MWRIFTSTPSALHPTTSFLDLQRVKEISTADLEVIQELLKIASSVNQDDGTGIQSPFILHFHNVCGPLPYKFFIDTDSDNGVDISIQESLPDFMITITFKMSKPFSYSAWMQALHFTTDCTDT